MKHGLRGRGWAGVAALTGGLLLAWPVMTGTAMAESGQCTFGEEPAFDCEIERDGTSFAFDLTDGRTLVFQEIEPGLGYVYLDLNNSEDYADPEGADYQWTRPKELGEFRPIEGEVGCWGAGDPPRERFCAVVAKEGK